MKRPFGAPVARMKGAELEHLRFDVGVDFAVDAEGRLVSTKSSYYGTL